MFGGRGQMILLEFVIQRDSGDAELTGHGRHVSSMALERFAQKEFFLACEIVGKRQIVVSGKAGRSLNQFTWKILDIYKICLAVQRGVNQHIEQLPYVPRPAVSFHGLNGTRGEADMAVADLPQNMIGNEKNVLFAFGKGRKMDGQSADAIIEILPEGALLDHFLKVAVCC